MTIDLLTYIIIGLGIGLGCLISFTYDYIKTHHSEYIFNFFKRKIREPPLCWFVVKETR